MNDNYSPLLVWLLTLPRLMTCKLHGALKIGARSIIGCYRLTHRLHDCLCIHLPPIAETVLPKPAILTDYNDIHTQTSLIIHKLSLLKILSSEI